MTRIAFIAGTYQPQHCGVAHYTAHLRSHLADRAVESIVLTTHEAAQGQDATIMGAVNGWQLADLLPLVQAIHRTKADVLHIQHAAGTYGFNRAIFLLPLLLKLTGWRAPIVTTAHEYGWWEWQPKLIPPQLLEELKQWGQARGWWDREDGFLLTQSQAIITTNREAEEAISKRLPDLKSRLRRIPIAANVEVASIDRQQARLEVRQAQGWAKDTPIIAFFSFLHPVKGLETLLPAFQQVVATHPQARLLIIGGVESLALPEEQANRYWHKLEAQMADLNLTSVAHMTGYLEASAVSRCLLASDIGVLPFNPGVTLKSGSLLAMMAHALPVIATRSQPPDPGLLNDQLLYSIAPRDPQALSQAISELLSDASQRHRLGAAAYQFSQQFTWSNIADTHLTLYQTLLNQPTHPVQHPWGNL